MSEDIGSQSCENLQTFVYLCPHHTNVCKFRDFVSFQQITFKLGNLSCSHLKVPFPELTEFPNLPTSKVQTTFNQQETDLNSMTLLSKSLDNYHREDYATIKETNLILIQLKHLIAREKNQCRVRELIKFTIITEH